MDAPSRLRTVLASLTLPLLVAAIGSAPAPASDAEVSDAPTAPPDEASLRAADVSFQAYAANRDRIRFQTLLDRDALFFADELHRGFGAVLHAWDPLWNEKDGFSYRGDVLQVTVAESGELGFTIGRAETRYRPPVDNEDRVQSGYYVTVWTRGADGWRVAASGALVVHPTLGESRDPRGALMTSWPELAERIDADLELRWTPESTARAESGELAWVFGSYEARFDSADGGASLGRGDGGSGHFLAIWQKDGEGRWQLAAEAMTPPALER